ncbi:MAG: helicase-related protein, partial [Planctomycetota bacterium]|nr:helicase-related protein [Planctomycetota bacterium]
QVYFVHNRVKNIEEIAQTLQKIAPEATIGIVHGQMNEKDLEREMLAFVSGQTDILVATTIIESGLDIQNANTMFIHQAEIYGLADMHQLRGRVGRHTHRAYCYLIPTVDKVLTPTAAKRLKAIEEYTELGAGFKIAMRDLEIRGAGNILGTEQSGHISQVGYELYCQLLENAVRRLKNLPPRDQMHVAIDLPVSAFVPPSYVPPGRQKIEVYRKLSQVRTVEELAEVAEELRDRFGPAPPDLQRLLQVKELQVFARHWQIDDIHLEGDEYAVFSYRKPALIHALAERVGRRLRIVDTRFAYWILEADVDNDEELLADLRYVLEVVQD